MTSKRIVGKWSYMGDMYRHWKYTMERISWSNTDPALGGSPEARFTLIEKIKYTFWSMLDRHYYVIEHKCRNRQWRTSKMRNNIDNNVRERFKRNNPRYKEYYEKNSK